MSTTIEKKIETLSPAEAKARFDAGELVLIDVRTEVEHAVVHAQGVEHHPLDRMDCAEIIKRYDGKLVACICKSGMRGSKAAQALLDAGATRVANIAGGTTAWEASGLPVNRVSNVMPLERQTLLVAGAIVMAGVLLGAFVHPYWYGLSGFVGCGLMFAGLTGFCGMGLVLARMPWNRNLNNKSCCGGQSCAAS
jgi:rhodanese-related sulfurtransferase